jgi:hypothetical protein
LRIDPWGRPVVFADFKGALTVAGNGFSQSAWSSIVLRAYPATLAPNFSSVVGGNTDVTGTAMAVSSDGAIFVAGSHLGGLSLPDGSKANSPGIFFLRWSP